MQGSRIHESHTNQEGFKRNINNITLAISKQVHLKLIMQRELSNIRIEPTWNGDASFYAKSIVCSVESYEVTPQWFKAGIATIFRSCQNIHN